MTDAARRLIEQAMELSAEERLRVAEELVESVRDSSEPGWDEAWRLELERRVAELRSGAVESLPWSEVRERLRAAAGR